MAPRSFPTALALAVLLACALVVAEAAKKPNRKPPAKQPASPYRYISVTRYNSSADVQKLFDMEMNMIMKPCKAAFTSAVMGLSNNYEPTADFGHLVKVIDFSSPGKRDAYETCSPPAKALIDSYISDKARAFFPIAGNTPLSQYPDNAFYRIGLSNPTDINMLKSKRADLIKAFAGKAVLDYVPGVSPADSPYAPSKNYIFANWIVFKYPQAAQAYYTFKAGAQGFSGKTSTLPLYAEIQLLEPMGPKDTEFFGTKV